MFEATKTRNVFKSRWNALFWSLSMMLTAYCSIPEAEVTNLPAVDSAVAAKAPNPQAALNRWEKGQHYAIVKSQEPPMDDLEKLQKASDEARAALAKVQAH